MVWPERVALPLTTALVPRTEPFRLNVTVPAETVVDALTVATIENDDGQMGLAGLNETEVVEVENGTVSAVGAERALSPAPFTALTSNT